MKWSITSAWRRNVSSPFLRENEMKTYFYQPLDLPHVLRMLSQMEEKFSLNLSFQKEMIYAYFCLPTLVSSPFFRNTSFPLVYPFSKSNHHEFSYFRLTSLYPALFPFEDKNQSNMIHLLQRELKKLPSPIYVQLLFQKQKPHWKSFVQQQYADYLSGIHRPSDRQWIREIQYKVKGWKDKYRKEKTDTRTLHFLEQRLAEDGFMWCIRLAIQENEKQKAIRIAQKIKMILSSLSGMNGFSLQSILYPKRFAEDMQLHRFSFFQNPYQIMTTSEMVSFFITEQKMMASPFPSIEEEQINKEETEDSLSSLPSDPVALPTLPPMVSLLPKGDQQLEAMNNWYEKVLYVFRKLNLKGKEEPMLVEQFSGTTLDKVIMRLPQGLKYNMIEKECKNIEAELGVEGISIQLGKEPETFSISIAKERREIVWLGSIFQDESYSQLMNAQLPLVFGKRDTGEWFTHSLEKLKHLLVCGSTGSGKSVLLNCLILFIMMTRSPSDVRFFLIDPKRVELSIYDTPHVEKIETDSFKAIDLLKKITAEMDRRYSLFEEQRVRNLDSYNKKVTPPLPRLIVVIDEFADLILLDPTVEEPVVRLLQLARACGIHVIIATQRPSVDVVTGLIKANLLSRIVFACSSIHDYKTCLDGKPPKLLGLGDGVGQLEGVHSLIRFQGAVVSLDDEEIENIILSIREQWNGNFEKLHLPDASQKVEPEDDLLKLKRIIALTQETKGTVLQKTMKIRREKITDLMKQLVVEGWLHEPESTKKGYVLAKTQEEMIRLLEQDEK